MSVDRLYCSCFVVYLHNMINTRYQDLRAGSNFVLGSHVEFILLSISYLSGINTTGASYNDTYSIYMTLITSRKA